MHILDWLEQETFNESLSEMIGITGMTASPDGSRMPRNSRDRAEARLGKQCGGLIFDDLNLQLRDWWLVKHAGANVPNWDLACATTTDDGRPGLVLVEAKAHVAEFLTEAKRKGIGNVDNHARITSAIEEARRALSRQVPNVGMPSTDGIRLFPSATYVRAASRSWFLIPHDHLFDWAERRPGKAPKWDDHWSYPNISKDLAAFIAEYEVVEREPDSEPKLIAAPTPADLPPEGDAEAIFAFAMSFDGYARLGSFEASAEAANARRRSSLDDIRNELFFSARASRYGGDDKFVRTYSELLPLLRELLGARRVP